MGSIESVKVSSVFRETCHMKLRDARISSDEKCLELHILNEQQYLQWKWNIYPLATFHRHLLLPIYFNTEAIDFASCQPNTTKLITFNAIVGYEPFVYTLRNEILTRKLNHTFFASKQIHKILKAMLFALKNWLKTYDDFQIGSICPENVVFDSQGHVKIIHLFSFPPQHFIVINGQSHSYFDINPINKLKRKTTSQEQRRQNITLALNQIGDTLLQMMTINKQKKQSQAFNQSLNSFILEKLLGTKIKGDDQLNEIIEIFLDVKNQ